MRRTTAFLIGVLGAALLVSSVPTRLLYGQSYSTTTVANAPFTKTVTYVAASAATTRLIHSRVLITPAAPGNTFAITSSGSLAAARGEVVLSTGKAFTDGFLFGTQGKATLNGTFTGIPGPVRAAGILGQTDTTGATLTPTQGQISGVWADLQGNTANAETYPLRVSNSSSVNTIPALGIFIGRAAAALEFSDFGNSDFFVNAAGTGAGQCAQTGGIVATKTLKVVVGGTNYWIPLCTAP